MLYAYVSARRCQPVLRSEDQLKYRQHGEPHDHPTGRLLPFFIRLRLNPVSNFVQLCPIRHAARIRANRGAFNSQRYYASNIIMLVFLR